MRLSFKCIEAAREFSLFGIVRELGPIKVFISIYAILDVVIAIWLTTMMSQQINNYLTQRISSEIDVIPGWQVIIAYVFLYGATYTVMNLLSLSIIFIFPYFLYDWFFEYSATIDQFVTKAKLVLELELYITNFDVERAIWMLLNGSGLLYISLVVCVLSIFKEQT